MRARPLRWVWPAPIRAADTISNWTITWGDGSPAQVVAGNPSSVTHVYAAGPNNYTISATATDEDGTYSASNTVAVGVLHIPPTISVSGLNLVNKGAIYTLNLSGSDTAPHAINSWSITWGDGSPAQVVAGSATTVTHTYTLAPANVTISATATDDVATYSAGNTIAVSVTNLSRPVLAISGAAVVNEGAIYTLWLSGDPATGHPITQWTVNWGDGSSPQTVAGNPFSVTHVFASGPHSYTISATATDNVGTYNASNTPSVSVMHVSPKLTLSGAASVNEAVSYTLNLSSLTFGGHAINQWHINWGDGGPVQTVAGNPPSTTHVYATGPHNYTISADGNGRRRHLHGRQHRGRLGQARGTDSRHQRRVWCQRGFDLFVEPECRHHGGPRHHQMGHHLGRRQRGPDGDR